MVHAPRPRPYRSRQSRSPAGSPAHQGPSSVASSQLLPSALVRGACTRGLRRDAVAVGQDDARTPLPPTPPPPAPPPPHRTPPREKRAPPPPPPAGGPPRPGGGGRAPPPPGGERGLS